MTCISLRSAAQIVAGMSAGILLSRAQGRREAGHKYSLANRNNMNTPEPFILLGKRGQSVATITLNRPLQRNPLDHATIKQFRAAISRIEEDQNVSMVIVRGAGGNLSAGGDMKGYLKLYRNPEEFREFLEDFYGLLDSIEKSEKVYILIVDGYCVAGGLELLLTCDIVMAAQSAKIGDGHLNFGQLPGAGGSQRLPRAVGAMRARYMIATGDLIDAAEAERIGLVSRVVADSELDAAVDALISRLTKHSPLGLKGMKHLVNAGLRSDLESGLRMELEYVLTYATTTDDATEGLSAFSEKRTARFSGT